uniref:Uncharacterized protein n=1 Tax=Anguilla anguilla TaxID=7936 RepID=A0A0E9S6I4_ANGAN
MLEYLFPCFYYSTYGKTLASFYLSLKSVQVNQSWVKTNSPVPQNVLK